MFRLFSLYKTSKNDLKKSRDKKRYAVVVLKKNNVGDLRETGKWHTMEAP